MTDERERILAMVAHGRPPRNDAVRAFYRLVKCAHYHDAELAEALALLHNPDLPVHLAHDLQSVLQLRVPAARLPAWMRVPKRK